MVKKITGISIGVLSFIVLASPVRAATLYFDPQSSEIGTEKDFTVALNITAKESINALDVSLIVPAALVPTDSNDGNSIVNFWLKEPVFDPRTRILSFSGIIPGGFIGNGGNLVILKFKAAGAADRAVIDFDRAATRIILNGPDGRADAIDYQPLSLPIVAGRENLAVDLPDTIPPENFKPEIFSAASLNSGLWTAVFSANDKGSGISHYEVQESADAAPRADGWQTATSPYILKDQQLRSFVFLKAVDNKGNERLAIVNPPNGSRLTLAALAGASLAALAAFVLVFGLIYFLRSVILKRPNSIR